jgi:hypothetical protein
MTVPDRHALKIARDTMRLTCDGAQILGGPNHMAAFETIARLTGKVVALASDCKCRDMGARS